MSLRLATFRRASCDLVRWRCMLPAHATSRRCCHATTYSPEDGAAPQGAVPHPASARPGDRIVLDQVAESVHLMAVDGFEWIDFVADTDAVGSILHDGGFVMATRKMLIKHGVGSDVIARVARDVWLPVTHFSGDGESIAVVTRVPYTHGDRLGTGVMWTQGISHAAKSEIDRRDDATTESATSDRHPSESHGEIAASHSGTDAGATQNLDMTILGLTVRLNVFIHKASKKIITVHRYPLRFIVELQKNWHVQHRFDSIDTVLFRLLQGSTRTFEERQVEYARRLDWLESILFQGDDNLKELDEERALSAKQPGGVLSSVARNSRMAWLLRRTSSWLFWWQPRIQYAQTTGRNSKQDYAATLRIMQHERDRQNLRRSMWWGAVDSSNSSARLRKGTTNAAAHEALAAHVSHQFLMSELQKLNRQASATVRVLREVEGAYKSAALALCPPLPLVPNRKPAPHDNCPDDSARDADADDVQAEANEAHERRSEMVQRRLKTLRGQLHGAIFLWDGLREQSQSLLSLQVSVAVSRLEELLRYLTVFSTIFIPLELVTSFFGMNFVGLQAFQHHNEHSQWLAVVLMVGTALWTQRWIRRTTSSVTSRGVVY